MTGSDDVQRPDPLRPGIALVAWAESLADGRRVLVIGDADSGLAERLRERGARAVQVLDPDPLRAAQAATANRSRNIAITPLADDDLGLREGAFDLALVENLASLAEPAALVRRVRRALGAQGAAVFAAPNPDVRVRLLGGADPIAKPLDYYGLYDVVAAEFEHVRMLGQAPFVGYAVAHFAPESEPEPIVDTGWVPAGAEEPEWFVALGSRRSLRTEAFAIVQTPLRLTLGPEPTQALEQQLAAARTAERSLRERMAELEARLIEKERAPAPVAPAAPEAAPERAADEQRRLEELQARSAELETELAAARREAAAARDELAAERLRAAEARAQIAAQRGAEARAEELERERDALAAQLAAMARERDAWLGEIQGEAQSAEVSTLEAALADRAAEVRRLTRELAEAERIGRELVRRLQQQPPPDGRELEEARRRLDELAHIDAERSADLEALRWSVQELEARLSQ